VKRPASRAFKEDAAMNEPTKSRDVSALIALVNAMIEYWKEIARRNFVKAHPQAEPTEFERHWPKALANFFLAETVRVAKSLNTLSKNRNN
jgi:hypothetical protein